MRIKEQVKFWSGLINKILKYARSEINKWNHYKCPQKTVSFNCLKYYYLISSLIALIVTFWRYF